MIDSADIVDRIRRVQGRIRDTVVEHISGDGSSIAV